MLRFVLNLLLLASLLLPMAVNGQAIKMSKFFYDGEKEKLPDARGAVYYTTFTQQASGNYAAEMHRMKDDLLLATGTYSSIDSEIRDGFFVTYTDSGFKLEEGNYVHSKRDGVWKYYYKNATQLYYICNYKNGLSNGQLISYYPSGKMKRNEIDTNDIMVSATCYDEDGKEMQCGGFMVTAKPSYNLYSYLASNLTYPEKARRKGIEGRAVITFTVDTDGTIHNAHITHALGGGCDQEALRVVKNMPKWIPASIDGKPVTILFSQPVTFWLEGGKEFKNAATTASKSQTEYHPRIIKQVDVRRK